MSAADSLAARSRSTPPLGASFGVDEAPRLRHLMPRVPRQPVQFHTDALSGTATGGIEDMRAQARAAAHARSIQASIRP